jgi:purine-binding chemotaxis protein CheW
VREVAPLPELARPPSLPASAEGLMNLGGEAIVVINLMALLDLAADPEINPVYRHILVMAGADGFIGLLVDRVEDVRAVAEEAIMPADEQSSINGCVVGHVEVGGATAYLLDASRIFLAAERARFADIQRSEQARLDAVGA